MPDFKFSYVFAGKAFSEVVEFPSEEQAREYASESGWTFGGECLDGPNKTTDVLGQVAAERECQNAKWGEQNHPDGTDPKNSRKADAARDTTKYAARFGVVTWRMILEEEFWEAMAETDPERLKTELIHVAAVAVQWVEAIDRREN